MDTRNLSKIGFTIIRNLLEGRCDGGAEAAKELADVLHNLPEPGNWFLSNLTKDLLAAYIGKYPHLSEYFERYINATDQTLTPGHKITIAPTAGGMGMSKAVQMVDQCSDGDEFIIVDKGGSYPELLTRTNLKGNSII